MQAWVRRSFFLILGASLFLFFMNLLRGHPISWDEIEFFRATRWTAQGRVPFRDFWEHHLPLQWIVFAPAARWLAQGPGVEAILAMRIAQLPLLAMTFLLLARIAGRDRTDLSFIGVVALLFCSPLFANAALEYRVDTLGVALLVAGLATAVRQGSAWPWPIAGALLALAVLANMRLAPLVIVLAVLLAVIDPREGRVAFRPATLLMTGGVFPVAAAFVLWLHFTGAWSSFVEGVFEYNRISNAMIEEIASGSRMDLLLSAFHNRDAGILAVVVLAVIGMLSRTASLRRPDAVHLTGFLAIASLGLVLATGVQYPYHLLTTFVLLLPASMRGLEAVLVPGRRPRWAGIVIAVAWIACGVQTTHVFRAGFGERIRYEDEVMTAVDTWTSPGATVLDGVGYALRREPAQHYWFLPAGVRVLSAQGRLQTADLEQFLANPPGAIIYGVRLRSWFQEKQAVQAWAMRHYAPLYRDLWLPAPSAVLDGQPGSVRWVVPARGRYRIVFSPLLARHPWLSRPHEYLVMDGDVAAGMEIPIARLPRGSSEGLRWMVKGRERRPERGVLMLEKSDHLELHAPAGLRGGLMLVPEGIDVLCRPAATRFWL
jgi:hypothetical protein